MRSKTIERFRITIDAKRVSWQWLTVSTHLCSTSVGGIKLRLLTFSIYTKTVGSVFRAFWLATHQWLSCTIHWFTSSSSERGIPNSLKLRAKCLPGLLPQCRGLSREDWNGLGPSPESGDDAIECNRNDGVSSAVTDVEFYILFVV